MKVKTIFWVVVIYLAFPLTGMGAGFHIREQGAKAMGMANAFVAQADDPSAVFYNPAGIAFQDGTAVSLGITVINVPETEFTGNTELGDRAAGLGVEQNADTRAHDDIFFPPNFYITSSKVNPPWAYRVGMQYELTEALDLRLIYTRDNNPIPDDTVGPALPGADRDNYTFGLGYKAERAVFDFAYMLVDFDDRDVNNDIQTGTYKSDAYLFAADLTYFF